jgi:hypothetical protein
VDGYIGQFFMSAVDKGRFYGSHHSTAIERCKEIVSAYLTHSFAKLVTEARPLVPVPAWNRG